MVEGLPEGTVTVLFTDVEGSTALANLRGDEAAQDILRAQRELVRERLKEHGGYEVKGTGDGFMVAFASAKRAVGCATAIQRSIHARNLRVSPQGQARVRIGINAGEVIREEQDLFGATVNAAARIAAKAAGSQILVSDTVKSLLGSSKDVRFVDRGRFRLKGFEERWHLHELVWQEEEDRVRPPAVTERTPFVRREAERAELRRLLEEAIAGRGSLVLLAGEAGIGKSRLAEELAAEGRGLGAMIFAGHCYEMEGSPPYLPFVEILQSAARSIARETLRAALGESAPEVAKILPELRRVIPDIAPPLELPAEQERLYLFNSVRDFLAAASSITPIVLLLEDLQWADDSSLLLLQHIAQQLPQTRIVVVGTYRDVEMESGRPLARAVEELNRRRLARAITLRRLDEEGLAAMLRALSGYEPPPQLVRVLYTETEGNPFFAEEVVKHLADEGRLFDVQGRWRDDLEVGETDVPESIRMVLARRLQRVSEDCRRMLTAAAVIGRRFTLGVLDAASGIESDALLDALDEAERAHIIVSSAEDSVAAFTFNHELTRQTLLSQISVARRQRLHLRVAESTERLHAHAQQGHAADVAYHLSQAGAIAEPDKTAQYLALTGDHALAAAAFEDALRHYEHALSLVAIDDRRARANLTYKRGLALRGIGRWDEALVCWRESIRLYRTSQDMEHLSRVYSTICQQLIWSGRFLEALEMSVEGLVAVGSRPSADRALLLSFAGLTLGLAGFYAPAKRMIAAAGSLSAELQDDHLLGKTLLHKAMLHFAYAQMPQQLEASDRAIALLKAAGDRWELANAMWMKQLPLLASGRFGEVQRLGAELEPLASRLGHLGALMFATRIGALVRVMQTGDLQQYEESVRREVASSETGEMVPIESGAYGALAGAKFWRGDWEEALRLQAESARLEPGGVLAGMDHAGLLIFCAYAGRGEQARAILDGKIHGAAPDIPLRRSVSLLIHIMRAGRSAGLGPMTAFRMLRARRTPSLRPLRLGQPCPIGSAQFLLTAIEALFLLGEQARAGKLYRSALALRESSRSMIRGGAERLMETVLGIAATAAERWDRAEEHFTTAMRQAEELPHRVEQPDARAWYARMLLARGKAGDSEKARQLLRDAIAMYRDMGMVRHQEIAEQLISSNA